MTEPADEEENGEVGTGPGPGEGAPPRSPAALRSLAAEVRSGRPIAADEAVRLIDDLRAAAAALGEDDRPDDALDTTAEAVATARHLAASDPDRFRPLLAIALSNLAARRWHRGQQADAIAAGEESLSIYDRLVDGDGPGGMTEEVADRHLPTLENQAIFSSQTGALDRAIELRRRVLALRLERLAAVAPSGGSATDPPDVAPVGAAAEPPNEPLHRPPGNPSIDAAADAVGTAVARLIADLFAAERLDEAEGAIDAAEAVVVEQHHRLGPADHTWLHELSATVRRLRRGLVAPLHARSVALADRGDLDEALATNAHLVSILRDLVGLDRAGHRLHLALELDARSSLLARADQAEDALVASHEAVGLLPDPTGDEVLHAARAQHHLAARLGRLGAHREAVDAARQAVALFERMAMADPAAGDPMLLTARHDLANRLGGLGDHDEAIALARTAVDDARRLAATDRDRYVPSLVAVLDHLATLLAADGSAREARKVRREHDRLRPEARRIVRTRTNDVPAS